MERESFVFYQSFRRWTKHLPKDNQKNALVMMVEYWIDWIEPNPETDGIAYAMFLMAKPQIDKNNQRFSNWLDWWRPKKDWENKQKPKDNQKETKHKANDNVNDNVNDNNKEKISDFTEFKERWNSVPKFWVANIWLPKTIKDTPTLMTIYNKKRKIYSFDELIHALQNYVDTMIKVPKENTFHTHRFSMIEFLEQKNWLEKYINFSS